jgi:hypothetical protein
MLILESGTRLENKFGRQFHFAIITQQNNNGNILRSP